MRKATKKQILELIGTVGEALQYIKRAQEDESKLMVKNCLMCMRLISNLLEEENERAALREIFSFNQMLDKAMRYITKRERWIFKLILLEKQLAAVENHVQEIQARLEIVFIPYKVSMWDSLESIWRAADADENCDAYVIPIPYYDINPDRSIAKVNYEGDLYPEDVSITDYRNYDLKKRHPDMIYFHNPYDGYNLVTSVLPEFYSEKLKRHTDMLVYVPYFVAMEDVVSRNFCLLPGVLNADRVIVQSEKIKKAYGKYVSEDKVLALGSPKFDKVIWTKEHPPQMPEEWKKIARGRKLILYNTHLSCLINDDGSVCGKLRYVFSCFEGRDDVCLLWRPHPLSEATLKAMNPLQLAEYMQLVQIYIEKEIGIFDNTADVHRAIALSDAYYGDWSSLVEMYKITGKPIMIQDIKLTNRIKEESLRSVSFINHYVEGETLWFTAHFFNGLFKVDLNTGIVSFIGRLPYKGDRLDWLYSTIIRVQESLFIFPAQADAVAEFNTETGCMKQYPIAPHIMQTLSEVGFGCAVLWNEWVYMIPWKSREFLRFHLKTKKFEAYSEWFDSLRPYLDDEDGVLFGDHMLIGSTLWCICRQGHGLVAKFDLLTMRMKIHQIHIKQDIPINMSVGDGYIWIIEKEDNLLFRWNPENNSLKKYENIPQDFFVRQCNSSNFVWQKESVWIFPRKGKCILKLDLVTSTMSEQGVYPDKYRIFGVHPRSYAEFSSIDNMILSFPMDVNMFLKINMDTGEIQGQELYLTDHDLTLLIHSFFTRADRRDYFNFDFYLERNIDRDLYNYTRLIATHQNKSREQKEYGLKQCSSGNSGELIYNCVKRIFTDNNHL